MVIKISSYYNRKGFHRAYLATNKEPRRVCTLRTKDGRMTSRFVPISACNDSHSILDDKLYEIGNYFSEGFLTEEKLNEYEETVKKLFNKWRGLK